MTASGCDPSRVVRLKDSTIKELDKLKPLVPENRTKRPKSTHNVVQ